MNADTNRMPRKRSGFYRKTGKPIFDYLLAVFISFFLWPFMVEIALLIWLEIGPPVLFRHKRPGLHEKSFAMLKFRTMNPPRMVNGQPLTETERLTSLGRFLRSFSLDEMPALINVLRGEMSLVGPRPLLMEYLSCYTPEQRRRHDIKPGITGWAQIHGRNECLFSKRMQLDVWYVEHVSFRLDLRIIFSSLFAVTRGRGVRSDLEQCLSEVDDLGFSKTLSDP
jgi:lipopolysaccharide/colanic/teichoic acid biosynthesis glycosyltransferase